MKTFVTAICSSLILVAGLSSAFADSSATAASTQNSAPTQTSGQQQNAGTTQGAGQQNMGGMTVRQQLQKTLDGDGYKNVQIIPSSFLVRAQDKQGHPVMMVISPDSVTEVTEVPGSSGSTQNNMATTNGSTTQQ